MDLLRTNTILKFLHVELFSRSQQPKRVGKDLCRISGHRPEIGWRDPVSLHRALHIVDAQWMTLSYTEHPRHWMSLTLSLVLFTIISIKVTNDLGLFSSFLQGKNAPESETFICWFSKIKLHAIEDKGEARWTISYNLHSVWEPSRSSILSFLIYILQG